MVGSVDGKVVLFVDVLLLIWLGFDLKRKHYIKSFVKQILFFIGCYSYGIGGV